MTKRFHFNYGRATNHWDKTLVLRQAASRSSDPVRRKELLEEADRIEEEAREFDRLMMYDAPIYDMNGRTVGEHPGLA